MKYDNKIPFALVLSKRRNVFEQCLLLRSAITPVSNGRELVGEVVEGGEGVTSWHYVCRAYCPSTGIHTCMFNPD